MECPKCQAENRDSAKFYIGCGDDRRQTQEPVADIYAHPQFYILKHLTDEILTIKNAIEGKRKI
ncbi:hypothetical protein C6A37_02840 [Desulfobacteraceae bacterium SEEP-SAG9]|nr:hypothetical protein C6A37_02840 [Desulfobacteraceae bacterium SEEP-SAG9]